MEWIIENKDWLFSGILVAVPLAFVGFLLSRSKLRQKQVLGKKSKGYQSGRDINIGKD